MKNQLIRAVSAVVLFLTLLPAAVSAETEDDSWQFGASIYGWFPDMSGRTSFPLGGGEDFTVSIGDILDNLQFTFQGSFDARKGNWGLFTDVIYMDIGKNDTRIMQGTIGELEIPAEVTATANFDMKSWIWTTAGYYRLVSDPEKTFDFLFGLRYADVEQSLNWSFSGEIGQLPLPGPDGNAEVGESYWDAVVGFRGRLNFGQDNAWFIPYYADVGTGDSDLTWQVAAGIGYSFSWGEVAGLWRYLEYDLPSGKPIGEMDFSGPAAGVVFRW